MCEPHPYRNLSGAELADLPRVDAVARFSDAELHATAQMIMPPEAAALIVKQLVELGPGAFMYGDLLFALSLGSQRAAAVVREILGEDEESECTRLSGFRKRYPAAPPE